MNFMTGEESWLAPLEQMLHLYQDVCMCNSHVTGGDIFHMRM